MPPLMFGLQPVMSAILLASFMALPRVRICGTYSGFPAPRLGPGRAVAPSPGVPAAAVRRPGGQGGALVTPAEEGNRSEHAGGTQPRPEERAARRRGRGAARDSPGGRGRVGRRRGRLALQL